VNVFEFTLTGTLSKTYRTKFSNEPAGITVNTSNGHWIVADDDNYRISDVDLGADHVFGTSDDKVTYFSADSVGDHDPEDVAYNPVNNHLFLADGDGAEVWELSPGSNGKFDGVPPGGDDTVKHFDTKTLGLTNPEGIGVNSDTGTLYLSSRGAKFILETTTTGTVIRKIDTSSVPSSRPSGIAYAPSSTNASVNHLYLSDRGADNDSDSHENDGRVFELTLPSTSTTNQAPSVDAGLNLTVTLPAPASLNGAASDDGLPAPAALTLTWSKVSGPGSVSFANSHAAVTTATFTAAGTYVLRLTADDGALTGTDDLNVTVGGTISGVGGSDFRVAAGSDDAEESSSGSMSLTSSDLELVNDGNDQRVGVRFTGVAIPQGATIATAYIQFQADETQSETTNLLLQGQAIDNAPTFTSSSGNVSSRARTAASASWGPAAWGTVGEAGANQRTPELKTIVQEIVNRSGWTGGNAIAFIMTGTGHRTAVAYEGSSSAAPLLHVEFNVAPINQPPVVAAGPDRTITLPATASLSGSATDDGLPSVGAFTATWSKVSGPGTVGFADSHAPATSASFSSAGSYVLRLTGDDSVYTISDTVSVTVNPAAAGGQTLNIPVAASSDDAEERSSSTSLDSSDLELVYDGQIQKVGLRFAGLTIPKNAVITAAWVQFTADEAQSEATALTIQAQAADNAAAFTTASADISGRPRSIASVTWQPAAWTTVRQAGADQRSPDLSPILQEVVNRSGWASGNALAILITGTGHRTASSFDDSASRAPVLHVEWH
jgi:hypothetical protein